MKIGDEGNGTGEGFQNDTFGRAKQIARIRNIHSWMEINGETGRTRNSDPDPGRIVPFRDDSRGDRDR